MVGFAFSGPPLHTCNRDRVLVYIFQPLRFWRRRVGFSFGVRVEEDEVEGGDGVTQPQTRSFGEIQAPS